MLFSLDNLRENPLTLMRRAGYTFQRQENGEMSFIRPLASSGYPRFHMYTRVQGTRLQVSFHLDQKKHTYGDDTRHHGEYEESGPLQVEAERIQALLAHTNEPPIDYEP